MHTDFFNPEPTYLQINLFYFPSPAPGEASYLHTFCMFMYQVILQAQTWSTQSNQLASMLHFKQALQ